MKHMKQMFVKFIVIALSSALAPLAFAEGEAVKIPHQDWSFTGPFGYWDEEQLQRGFVIFANNCAACHSASRVKYRHLEGIGLSEEHIELLAAEQTIEAMNGAGELVDRPRLPTDSFPWGYSNKASAAAAFGKAPPDFSRLALAREDTADYIYAVLVGYDEKKSAKLTKEAQKADPNAATVIYNKYYGHTGGQIAMPNPLTVTAVSDLPFSDYAAELYSGLNDTQKVDMAARDITAFMMWMAEPSLEDRKRLGVSVILFMLVFTLLSWLAYRRIARKVHHELEEAGGGPWDQE